MNSKKQIQAYREEYRWNLDINNLARRKGLYIFKDGLNNTFPAYSPGCLGDVLGSVNPCIYASCVPDEGFFFDAIKYPHEIKSGNVDAMTKLFPKMYRCEDGVHCINGFKKPCPAGQLCIQGIPQECPHGAVCENGLVVSCGEGLNLVENRCE